MTLNSQKSRDILLYKKCILSIVHQIVHTFNICTRLADPLHQIHNLVQGYLNLQYSLPRYLQFIKGRTIYQAMDNLQSYGQFTKLCKKYNSPKYVQFKGMSNYKGLYNSPRYVQLQRFVQLTKVCTIHQGMFNLPRYIQFTKVCTIHQDMYNLPRYVQFTKMYNSPRYVQFTKTCTIYQGM